VTRLRRVTLLLVLAASVASLGGAATFSAFSAETRNDDNVITTGTVTISDNDANAFMYSAAGADATPQKSPISRCIQVTYEGTLEAAVRLYTTRGAGPDGAAFPLRVTVGKQDTPTFPSCTGFSADEVVYSGDLHAFGQTHASLAGGVPLENPQGNPGWKANDARVYKIDVSIPDSAEGRTTGLHDFVWGSENR
jgi:hypothetical protein